MDNQIICADALDGLRSLPDGCISGLLFCAMVGLLSLDGNIVIAIVLAALGQLMANQRG